MPPDNSLLDSFPSHSMSCVRLINIKVDGSTTDGYSSNTTAWMICSDSVFSHADISWRSLPDIDSERDQLSGFGTQLAAWMHVLPSPGTVRESLQVELRTREVIVHLLVTVHLASHDSSPP